MLVNRIKQIAKEKGMKMSDIAQAMKINPVNFSASINGNPTLGTLYKIANTLDVDIHELLMFKAPVKEVTGYLEVRGGIVKVNNRSDILKVLDMLDN
jgi:transcriptional regulator with XRE-family HTH domain